MTDLKFTSPSGETTLKFEDTGRIGTIAPKTQLHIKMDEPVKYEKPMTAVEDIEAQIKVLQSKLEFYKELEKTKSPVEEAYKRWMGEYPPTGPSVDGIDDIRWRAFQMGYNAAYEEKVSETAQERGERLHKDVERCVRESVKWCEENADADPLDWLKPQTPEQVADGLKEAFRTAIKEGIIPEIKQPTDELIEKLVKKPPEFLKFELGKSLTDLIYDWWEDVFTTHSDWDMETSIEDLVDQIQMWLPKEQSAAGSQSLGVEDMVEGFNDCLKKIKSKLRNKKDT